jgi:tetratricopeptide (TPR) repeat protein
MHTHDESGRVELPHLSIAERLRRRHGCEVDPRVELAGGESPATPQSASTTRPFTSKVVSRLETRGAVASRYQSRREIGRGGMGAILEVFDEDLRRSLAMKVMLSEARGSTLGENPPVEPAKLARFLEEAQVTGQLDHPGIVPVHELGLDANGQVYFTMRLVRGRNLEAILRLVPRGEEGWSTTRAVGLLLKVCEAMAYAHSKGVVHRDLKPANVMVGQFGEVYVMDWGLARVSGREDRHDLRLRPQSERPTDAVRPDRREDAAGESSENLYTMDGDIMGTPSYMAPEQARGRLEAIGEASDVYSVGAMLYRLLTGVAPYNDASDSVRPLEIVERIYAGAPSEVELLAPNAPAELAAICSKAMAREPEQRYANMLALAEDLRAFLEGRVVGAFETGAVAEARKWIRRNKALAGALAATVVALVAGLAASIVLGRRASANAELAETRREAAEKSADEARRQARIAADVNSFLNDDLFGAMAPDQLGREVTVREVHDQAAQRLDGRFDAEPDVESALRTTIGTSYARLGQFPSAHEHLERAVELRRAHDGRAAETTLDSAIELASVLPSIGRHDEALELYDEIIEAAQARLGAEHRSVLTARNDQAIVLRTLGRSAEARAAYEALLPTQARVLGALHTDTLSTENNLALIESDEGDFDGAIERLERVVTARRSASGGRDVQLVQALTNLGTVYMSAGRLAESESYSREALELAIELYGDDHALVGRAQSNLGTIVFQRGRAAQALELFEAAWPVHRRAYGDEHPLTLTARGNLAGALLELGRTAEALEHAEPALEAQRRVLGERHAETLTSMNRIAVAYRDVGRLEESEQIFRELIDAQRELLGPDHPVTIIALENFGGLLLRKRDFAGAASATEAVLEARRRVLGERHPDTAKTVFNLGMVAKQAGDGERARVRFEEALALVRAIGESRHPLAAAALRSLGDLDLEQQAFASAVERYREAREIHLGLGPENQLTAYLQHQHGYAELMLERPGEALELLTEALAAREALLGQDDVGTRITLATLTRSLMGLDRWEEALVRALDLHERSLRAEGEQSDFVGRLRPMLVEIYAALGRPDDADRWR